MERTSAGNAATLRAMRREGGVLAHFSEAERESRSQHSSSGISETQAPGWHTHVGGPGAGLTIAIGAPDVDPIKPVPDSHRRPHPFVSAASGSCRRGTSHARSEQTRSASARGRSSTSCPASFPLRSQGCVAAGAFAAVGDRGVCGDRWRAPGGVAGQVGRLIRRRRAAGFRVRREDRRARAGGKLGCAVVRHSGNAVTARGLAWRDRSADRRRALGCQACASRAGRRDGRARLWPRCRSCRGR
jgi:hypothetical protein